MGGGQMRESVWSKINNAVPFFRETKITLNAVLFSVWPLFFILRHPPEENSEALPLTPHQSSWGPPNAWDSSVHLNVVRRSILNNRWPPHKQTSEVSHLVVNTNYLADNVFPSFPFSSSSGNRTHDLAHAKHMLYNCAIYPNPGH